MEIEIKSGNLVDYPYVKDKDYLFLFDEEILDDVASDIRDGNPTCYLVSGYRGVGKTSFIHKLQTRVSSAESEDSRPFFVHVSFARYTGQAFLIRNLLRQLFIKIKNDPRQSKIFSSQAGAATWNLLESLHKQTFHSIKESEITETFSERIVKLALNYKVLVDLVNIFIPTLITCFLYFGSVGSSYLLMLVYGIWFAFSLLNVTASFGWSEKKERKIATESLYDEEIASYHFLDLLKRMRQLRLKLVFVLDELDKVDEPDVETLLKEMKPFLVSGEASFIVVAGQRLFYRFYIDQLHDDAVLSSLFSRVIHVSLAYPADLRRMFFSNIVSEELNDEQRGKAEEFLSYLIFSSRLIHRRFINLVRQHSKWRNGKCYLSLSPTNLAISYDDLVKMISSIQTNYIESDDLSRGLKDHMVMSLYIECERMVRELVATRLR